MTDKGDSEPPTAIALANREANATDKKEQQKSQLDDNNMADAKQVLPLEETANPENEDSDMESQGDQDKALPRKNEQERKRTALAVLSLTI